MYLATDVRDFLRTKDTVRPTRGKFGLARRYQGSALVCFISPLVLTAEADGNGQVHAYLSDLRDSFEIVAGRSWNPGEWGLFCAATYMKTKNPSLGGTRLYHTFISYELSTQITALEGFRKDSPPPGQDDPPSGGDLTIALRGA